MLRLWTAIIICLCIIWFVWHMLCKGYRKYIAWCEADDYKRGVAHGMQAVINADNGDALRLLAQIDAAKCFGMYTQFDKGAEDALLPYLQVKGIEPLP